MKNLRAERREMNGILALFVGCKAILVLSSLFLGTVLYIILQAVYGEGADKAFSEFGSYGTLSGLLLEVAIFTLCLAVPICLYFFFGKKNYTHIVPQKKPELLQICYGVGATVVIGNVAATVGNILMSLLFSIFNMQDKYNAMLQSETDYPSNLWLVPLFSFVLAVMPAFLEEFLMRGIGLSGTRKYGTLFSLFFSGFFFAFMHSSWTQIPFAFVLGVVLAYFTLRFKTIWIAVISHFVFNFNSVIQCLILQNAGEYAEILILLWSLLFTTLMTGFVVAGAIVYGVRRPDVPKSEYSAGKKMKILFSSPFLYIFIVLEAVQLFYLLLVY